MAYSKHIVQAKSLQHFGSFYFTYLLCLWSLLFLTINSIHERYIATSITEHDNNKLRSYSTCYNVQPVFIQN